MLRKAKVRISDVEHAHTAYLDDNERWNGWLQPYFTKEECLAMNEWLKSDFDGDILEYGEKYDTFTTMVYGEVFQGVDIDGMHLYPIGNGCWTWELSE